MKRWMIVLSWWAQEFLDKPRRDHLTTDPACEHYRAPREGSRLDRMSRGLECEPCVVPQRHGSPPNARLTSRTVTEGREHDLLRHGSAGWCVVSQGSIPIVMWEMR